MRETAREKARRQLVSLLALAERPGTAAEGDAAWRHIEKLCVKYGFRIRGGRRPAPSFVTPKRYARSRRVWVVKGAGETVLREDGKVHASDVTTETYECEECGRTVHRRREGRRGRFCSPACRVRAHRRGNVSL